MCIHLKGDIMNAKIQKWGNSLALRIPRALAQESHLSQGGTVDMRIVDGKLVIEPQKTPRYELAELLAGVTRKNIHKEVSPG